MSVYAHALTVFFCFLIRPRPAPAPAPLECDDDNDDDKKRSPSTDRQTNGLTDGLTDGRTDGRTDDCSSPPSLPPFLPPAHHLSACTCVSGCVRARVLRAHTSSISLVFFTQIAQVRARADNKKLDKFSFSFLKICRIDRHSCGHGNSVCFGQEGRLGPTSTSSSSSTTTSL